MNQKLADVSYSRTLLFLLFGVMLAVTWGVGFAIIPLEGRNNVFYMTLIMLSVAEVLIAYHVMIMLSGKVNDKNRALYIGGSVMGLLYALAVVALTVAAILGVAFSWLVVLHAISLLALLVGWTIVNFAVQHAKSQDRKDERQAASFKGE